MTIHVVHYYDEPSCMELVDVDEREITMATDYTLYRLKTSGGDVQDFFDLDACVVEAKKYLSPENLGASSVTIDVIEEES